MVQGHRGRCRRSVDAPVPVSIGPTSAGGCRARPDWEQVRDQLTVKLVADDGDLYVLTRSGDRKRDVSVPTTTGQWLTMSRYTQPDHATQLLLTVMGLRLPPQPPPQISPIAPNDHAG